MLSCANLGVTRNKSFLHPHSNQDDGRMPLTRQCKANFIPLMLINKLLSEKSMHFSPLNVCDKFLICLKMKEIQKHWLLTGECGLGWQGSVDYCLGTGATAGMTPRKALQQLLTRHREWILGFGVKDWYLQLVLCLVCTLIWALLQDSCPSIFSCEHEKNNRITHKKIVRMRL